MNITVAADQITERGPFAPLRFQVGFQITTCYDQQSSQKTYGPFYCTGNVMIWVLSIINSVVLGYLTFLHFR